MIERDVRELAVYVDGRLALVARAEPGTLRSTAGPPPGVPGPPGPPGPPGADPGPQAGLHPFIDAQAHDPVSEGRLRGLLDESSGFDDYLARLLGAGFDIASWNELEPAYDRPGGRRFATAMRSWARSGRRQGSSPRCVASRWRESGCSPPRR